MKERFVIYVRTLQFWKYRLLKDDQVGYVFISYSVISQCFRMGVTQIEELVNSCELKIKESGNDKGLFFKVLRKGIVDLALLQNNPEKLPPLFNHMKLELLKISLPPDTIKSIYCDAFFLFREKNLDLFFTVDNFSGRIHTPITSLNKETRKYILIDNKRTISIDVKTMQPLLLGKLLKNQVGENSFSSWIDNGEDVYNLIKDKLNLKTRDEAKTKFYEILFSKPNEELQFLFSNENWVQWINRYKSSIDVRNKRSRYKRHSNLAWLLQSTEVHVMKKVWNELMKNNVSFLTVHDEIIVAEDDMLKSQELMERVLTKEFKYCELNIKT